MTQKEIANTAVWTVDVAREWNRGTLEVIARFKALYKGGMSMEQARNVVEQEYATGVIV